MRWSKAFKAVKNSSSSGRETLAVTRNLRIVYNVSRVIGQANIAELATVIRLLFVVFYMP